MAYHCQSEKLRKKIMIWSEFYSIQSELSPKRGKYGPQGYDYKTAEGYDYKYKLFDPNSFVLVYSSAKKSYNEQLTLKCSIQSSSNSVFVHFSQSLISPSTYSILDISKGNALK